MSDISEIYFSKIPLPKLIKDRNQTPESLANLSVAKIVAILGLKKLIPNSPKTLQFFHMQEWIEGEKLPPPSVICELPGGGLGVYFLVATRKGDYAGTYMGNIVRTDKAESTTNTTNTITLLNLDRLHSFNRYALGNSGAGQKGLYN